MMEFVKKHYVGGSKQLPSFGGVGGGFCKKTQTYTQKNTAQGLET
jgi:hypothetical protein